MGEIKKKCAAIGLSLALAVSAIWQGMPVQAEEYSVQESSPGQVQEKEESDLEISSKAVNSYHDIDEAPPVSVKEYEESHIPQDVSEGLESKYAPSGWADSENTTLPAVRNQNPLGTCWAHSIMSMIEMNLWKQGNFGFYFTDMSEFQSVFFMNHDWTDPLGLCSGDNFRTIDDKNSTALSPDWYNNGGNTSYAKFMLMDWVGAVSEIDYPDTAYNVLVKDKGNAYLNDSYAISKDKVHVQNVNVINSEDSDVIKQMIKEYGAVGISYYDNIDYYNEDTSAYYNDCDTTANHAVAIVGWDDSFDVSNFNTENITTAPAGNGAWLIRDSWGQDFGKNGYFWLSYYDKSLAKVAYSLDVVYKSDYAKDENYYDNNYQYDGGIDTTKMSFNDSVPGIEEANVFTASGKEVLKAVAIYAGANYSYDIKVYNKLSDKSNPLSGDPVASANGSQTYEGYHTVKLNNSVILNEGDIFSIVVKLKNNNSGPTEFAIDGTMNDGWIYSEAEAKENQSFYRPDIDSHAWIDAGAEGFNLRIKAYTNHYAEKPIASISFNEYSYNIKLGGTYNLAADMTVEPAEHDDKIIYSSSNEDSVTVDSNGVVTALKPGDAIITARALAGGAQTSVDIHVVFGENPITDITIAKTEHEMRKGETYDLAADMTVEPTDHDDLISYSSSDKSIAAVDDKGLITAVKIGDAEITATSYTKKIAKRIKIHVIPSEKPAESITLSKEQIILLEGDTEKIDATLTPADSDDAITWTSGNTDIATVDADGTVTGVTKGKTTVTATTDSGKSASCAIKVRKKRGEVISCVYNKLPKKIYKFNTYKISLSNAMAKLSPTKIDWVLSKGNKDNIVLTPVGENGKDGCDLYVKQVASARNRGEKLKLEATVTYIKTTKKGQITKAKIYRRPTTSYNLSYELELDTEDITITKKGDTIQLNTIFNDGEAEDQPTKTKVKWMITDASGKKDRYGSRVVSVNNKGIIKSKGPGVTYVTAFALDSYVKASRSYTVSDTIKVTCVPVTSVSFPEASLSLAKAATADLKAKLVFNNGTEEPFNKDGMKLKWTSSNKRSVSVNSKGVVKVTNKATAGETCKITVQATGGVQRGQTAPQATIDIIVQ